MPRAVYLYAPLVIFVAFYWPGLTIWFYQDDFGWLNLRHEVESWRDLPGSLFGPRAHGNLRPWSENGFFLLLSTLFGVNPLPFRLVVFATQCGNLLLLGSIARRLTGSAQAALWTQLLWIANSCLAVAACWTSIYNQFQYVFFILLALWFLVRYLDTGEPRYWTGQWIAFLLGFGSLEVNIVYPALAACCTWMLKPEQVRRTLPLFAVSTLYAALHFWIAPAAASGPYALHLDWALPSTLWSYWKLALGAERLARFTQIPESLVIVSIVMLTSAALLFALRDRIAAFGLAWFVILIAPLLPLRDHVTDYYVTGPAIGLALTGGWAIVRHRAAGAAMAVVYLAASVPASWMVTRWHAARAAQVETLVLGVAEIRRQQPEKVILLGGVPTDLFYAGIVDVPFRAMEIPYVYLAPGSEAKIQAPYELVSKFVLPEGMARERLLRGDAVVYDASGDVLRNVTGRYRTLAESTWRSGAPRLIVPGDPTYASRLSGGWGEPRNGYRAMSGRASFRIGGPLSPGERLYVGIEGPRHDFTLRADGMPLAAVAGGFVLPEALAGREEIEVIVEASRQTFVYFEIR